MKRYIDEKTGKIVNILEKDEANKVVKILIDYFFSEESMPAGRLNLVSFLKDFIKLGNIEDLNKIVDYIGEYKKGLKLSKEDEENFEVLYKFFRMYKDLEDSKLGIEDATNYISEMTNKKEEISKKEEKDMTKKDKILKVFFDNGFEFKRLAKVACEAWENNLKEQMSSGKKEIFVSLEQEIAYQDLLEFASSENDNISGLEKNVIQSEKKQVESKPETNVKAVEQTQDKKEEKIKNEEIKEESAEKTNKVDINVKVSDKKEPVKIEIETKNESAQQVKEETIPEVTSVENNVVNTNNVESVDKKEEKIHTIQINHHLGEDEMINGRGSNDAKTHVTPKTNAYSDPNKITQEDINSLLGLDEDLVNNSNSSNLHRDIRLNGTSDSIKSQVNNEEKNRREQGYTSNIQIFVPGVDDEKEQNNVNPSEVKKATENVDLKDSVDFFNNVLDDRMSKRSVLNDDSENDFRD